MPDQPKSSRFAWKKHPMLPFEILDEDGPLLAVNKSAGIPTQGVPDTVPSLETAVKAYLKEKYLKPGNVYLGIPHRLDRPVSGVVVFARNSKAAARLAEQFRLRQVRKCYLAVVTGRPDPPMGMLSDWLLKEPGFAKMNVVPEGTPQAKLATLSYRVLDVAQCARENVKPHFVNASSGSLVQIELHTGRMHQIRVQFASRGWPVVGDTRYGNAIPGIGDVGTNPDAIFLHASRLELRHPVRYDPISLVAPLPESWSVFGFNREDARLLSLFRA